MRRAHANPRTARAARSVIAALVTLTPAALGAGCEAPAASGAGTIQVQISGEDAATEGFLFPTGSEVVFSDGWELRFDHVFVTVGAVWLSDNPDRAPSDQSQAGERVAQLDGPWAVDLAVAGSVPGAGGEGSAVPIGTIDRLNLSGDAPLAADRRWAFSYSFVAASAEAEQLNFSGDEARAAYEASIADGCAVTYVGTARWVGEACASSREGYDWTVVPSEVPFRLCFATPTHYLNCQNEENQGEPFPDEEFQRGVPIKRNEASVAQITVHLEHPFYDDVQHEPRVFFDQLAAALRGRPAGTRLALEDLRGVDPTGFIDGSGEALPWRSCDGSALPDDQAQRAFSTGAIPINGGLSRAHAFHDYVDFVRYVQSTQGHLNGGEGLCYIDRQFPSPR